MKGSEVLLGYEVGTGTAVNIPLRHMVVTGQTQEAGKTTTLEALIARAGVRAVAFVTKRGEGSFANAHAIAPYFSEQKTDAGYIEWRYVAAILEASLGEKLKFERSWIMRATKGATTLAEVQRNVRVALEDPKTRGLSADVYFTLNEYLQAVVPQIARVQWARKVDLALGINAMDLGALGIEMQHLVIRSTIDWVLHHAEDTVVVVPEAWKFIPQGRGTPVKLAAEAFIRQAAALRNYLWLDSQDIAGIEKLILKSVPVWILGVQREVNEVKRTLEQMPVAVPKLTPRQVATLKLGEFYACFGDHAIKTYVQPTWMDAAEAQAIARDPVGATRHSLPPARTDSEEPVNEQEATRLRTENAELREQRDGLKRRIDELLAHPLPSADTADRPETPPPPRAPIAPVSELLVGEDLYQAIKRRLIDEAPVILKTLVERPELVVEVERVVIHVRGDTLRGRIARLIADDFFVLAKTSAQVLEELLRRGASRPSNIELGNELKALCELGFFTRDNKWFNLVPDMKVNVVAA